MSKDVNDRSFKNSRGRINEWFENKGKEAQKREREGRRRGGEGRIKERYESIEN